MPYNNLGDSRRGKLLIDADIHANSPEIAFVKIADIIQSYYLRYPSVRASAITFLKALASSLWCTIKYPLP